MTNVRQTRAVKLLLLCRQDQELEYTFNLRSLKPTRIDIAHHNADDIEKFISERLTSLAESNQYMREDTDSIRQFISTHALGMFQWARLVLYELNFAQSQDDVRRCLDRFPRELNEAYSKTFRRLSRTQGFDKENAMIVLKILLAAYRPLKWLDVAVAFKLHQELRAHPRIDLQGLHEIVNTATRKAHTLPDSYFAFLGPLVDIRSTADSDDTAKWHKTTDHRMTRTLVICHHSLTQWIEGVASAVEMRSDSWQEFHFSRKEAHEPLALLCLAMITSRSGLSTYLRGIYSPGTSTPPFLDYAGEYWSFHLRAVGNDLTSGIHKETQYRDGVKGCLTMGDVAGAALVHSIEISTAVVLALSTFANSIKLQDVNSLSRMISLRNLKNALLPSTQAIVRLKDSLPHSFRILRELRNEMGPLSDDVHPGASFDTTTTTLSRDLDSETVLRVLATLEARNYPTSLLQLLKRRQQQETIHNICKTSRSLRKLSILLAVDPLRTWINSQTSDGGLSPITALAHTSEAIDTYLAASLLPPELFSRYNFRDQFNAEHGHPQHGLIIAACRELSIRDDSSLDAPFYKEHIMKHYRISAWDWTITRLLIAGLQMSPNDPSGMDQAVKYWLASHKLWPQGPSDSQWESAFEVMSRLPFQSITRSAKKTTKLFSSILRAGVIFGFKYIVQVVPLLEHVFISATMNWALWCNSLKPTLKLLSQNRFHFLVALLIYLLRCRYVPWLFGTPQVANWNSILGPVFEVQGIVTDPKGYRRPFTAAKWPKVTFSYYLLQECIIWFLSMFDVLRNISPEDGFLDTKSNGLDRRASFRVKSASGNTDEYLKDLWAACTSHGLSILISFRRLLFIERIIFTLAVWIYDLIEAAAELIQSSPWKWGAVLRYGTQLGSFAFGRSAGLIGSLKLCLRIWVWSSLLSWYQPSSLLGMTYHYLIFPPGRTIALGLLNHYRNIVASLAWIIRLIDVYEARIIGTVNGLEHRTAIFILAGTICASLPLAWYVMSDPLSLQSATQSCKKAEELAKVANNIEEPIAFLKWQAKGAKTESTLAFTRMLLDLDREG